MPVFRVRTPWCIALWQCFTVISRYFIRTFPSSRFPHHRPMCTSNAKIGQFNWKGTESCNAEAVLSAARGSLMSYATPWHTSWLPSLRNGDPSGLASKLGNLRGLTLVDSTASLFLSVAKPCRPLVVLAERRNDRRRQVLYSSLRSSSYIRHAEKGGVWFANIFRRPSQLEKNIFLLAATGALKDF